ncbi:MAG: hypothetical protein AAFP19_14530 [Bacteroidota bacterium]
MRKAHFKILTCTWLLLIFGLSTLAAQNSISARTAAQKARAKKAITSLLDGALIVRIPSKASKIAELERLSKSTELSAKTRERMRAQLAQTKAERDLYTRELMAAFNAYYDFSTVYFAYDTAFTRLNKGQKTGLFLNEDLEIDPVIDLTDRPYLVLRTGTTDPSYTSGIEAMIFMDSDMEDLTKPFPYYVKMKSIGHIIQSIFYPNRAVRRSAEKIVQQMNRQLRSFHEDAFLASAP